MTYAYNAHFAQAYNAHFSSFAEDVAPRIHDFYVSQSQPEHARQLLDLCCGTGQCARYFLDRGFRVTGIDLSAPMVAHARANAGEHLVNGTATFLQADATRFTIDGSFGLVVSTFDAMNHLSDESELEACFRSVAAVTDPGGYFVFDLNTAKGARKWNATTVLDTEDTYLIRRGTYDGGLRAEAIITGFVRQADGRYVRFEQEVQNRVFELNVVAKLLRRSGWRSNHFAAIDNLDRAVRHPEGEDRVFVVARR